MGSNVSTDKIWQGWNVDTEIFMSTLIAKQENLISKIDYFLCLLLIMCDG